MGGGYAHHSQSTMIGLIDGNNFFASCERAFQPKLHNKPLIVLSSNDGCVIARSNEAKKLGIPMGAPLFTLKDLIQKNRVHILSSNFALYGDISRRMMTLIQQTLPRVEISSVDEAFMDFKGVNKPMDLSQTLHNSILKGLGIPTCVGLAPTKTLAKLANHIAKKNQVPVFLLQPHNLPQHILVDDVWGVGHQMKEALYSRGICTAVQLQQVDPRWMRQRFSVVGERLVRELQGITCLPVQNTTDQQQSIQVSRSFGKAITRIEDLHEAMAIHIEKLGEKLRQNQLYTQQITLFLKSSLYPTSTKNISESPSYFVNLNHPTQDTHTLLRALLPYVKHLFKQGSSYKKAGLVAMNLIPTSQAQQKYSLFAPPVSPCLSTSQALDTIRKKYGRGKLGFGSLGMPSLKDWMVKCDHQSPHYTTRWEDLPTVT